MNVSLKKGKSAKDLTRMLLSPLGQMCSAREHSLHTYIHSIAMHVSKEYTLGCGRSRGLQHARKNQASADVLHKELSV